MNDKILIIGDNEAAKWHPLKKVGDRLEAILKDYDVTLTEDYSRLTPDECKKYGLLVNYADAWQTKGTRQAAGAILAYVATGGSLLTLHSGIIMNSTPEMEFLQGGRFIEHPEACNLTYAPTDAAHPILDGISPFTVFEEPYRLALADLAAHELLMTYSHDGQNWPAAWTLLFGAGKVVYLSPGHQAQSFYDEMFSKLILNSVIWAMT
ncbi:MAG: ThuA domain-containing protein [Oscillospiraceae bacterium]|nr:ThuA domain-containing protein [Oscillospiraceae bacterium]